MSTVAVQSNGIYAPVYARPVRPVARPQLAAPNRPVPATASPVARVDVASVDPRGAGLASLAAGIDPLLRVSNALATADDRLAQMNDVAVTTADEALAMSKIDGLATSAQFGGAPLLDGSYTASLNGYSIALPSFRAADLATSGDGTHASKLISKTRGEIDTFRSKAIAPAFYAAADGAHALLPESPRVDDGSSAATNALLIRARVLTNVAAVADSSMARAQNVLSLIG